MYAKSSTGRRFTPNHYRLDGPDAYLLLTGTSGPAFETVIDADTLERALAFGRWQRIWSRFTQSYYAVCVNEGGMGLHRLVTDAPAGTDVDHRDHDTLNNRRGNLLVCSRSENLLNHRAGLASRSGVPHVHWYARQQKWGVCIQRGGKSHYFGLFATVAAAADAAQAGLASLRAASAVDR